MKFIEFRNRVFELKKLASELDRGMGNFEWKEKGHILPEKYKLTLKLFSNVMKLNDEMSSMLDEISEYIKNNVNPRVKS